jgi:hypothetical protein
VRELRGEVGVMDSRTIPELVREARDAFVRQCEVHGEAVSPIHMAALNNALVGIVVELEECRQRESSMAELAKPEAYLR